MIYSVEIYNHMVSSNGCQEPEMHISAAGSPNLGAPLIVLAFPGRDPEFSE